MNSRCSHANSQALVLGDGERVVTGETQNACGNGEANPCK